VIKNKNLKAVAGNVLTSLIMTIITSNQTTLAATSPLEPDSSPPPIFLRLAHQYVVSMNVNADKKNMGFTTIVETDFESVQSLANLNGSCCNEYTMQLDNGQNYFTVPASGSYYPYFDATLINNNYYGEWNVITAKFYYDNKVVCSYQIHMPGGGDDGDGGGYSYYNHSQCNYPVPMQAGKQIKTTYTITGTGESSPAVVVLSGNVSIQNFPQ
jgi:hypothetical protein